MDTMDNISMETMDNITMDTMDTMDKMSVFSSNITMETTELSLHQLKGKHIGIAILSVFCVIGNSSLIFTIMHHKHLRTVTNVFIVSLALADLLFGFPTAPLHILAESLDGSVLHERWLMNICLIANSLTSFQLIITMTMMLAITIERYVCILHPLKHRRWAQPCHVGMAIGLLWLYSSVYGVLPLLGWNALGHNEHATNRTTNVSTEFDHCTLLIVHTGQFLGVMFYGNVLPICIAIPFLYVRMFQAVRRFLIRKASNGLVYNVHPDQQIGYRGHRGSHSSHGDQETFRRVSRRSLRLLVVILIYFLFSWLPLFIWYCVATRGFTITHVTRSHMEHIPIPELFYQVAANLGFANSALNPYIYGLGNVRIRKAFIRMFRTCTCDKKPNRPSRPQITM